MMMGECLTVHAIAQVFLLFLEMRIKKGFVSLTDCPILRCQLLVSLPVIHSCNMFDVPVNPNQSSEHLPKYFCNKTCSTD